MHNLNLFNDPTQHPDVKIEMRRMYRTWGRHAKQAYGINKNLLDKILAATDNSLKGLRDRGNLIVAHDSLCRKSELVSLELEDVLMNEENGSVKLKLRKSKTDPHAKGRWLYLNSKAKVALKNWIHMSKLKSGKLFRSVTSSGKIKEGLNSAQINRIYKKAAMISNLDTDIIAKISGYSMRVGAAQDLLLSGATLPILMNRGRWSKTDTVMRYTELVNIT